MSKTKVYIENLIEKVAEETGYEFNFLMEMVQCGIDDGESIEEAIKFVSDVSYEQDWDDANKRRKGGEQ